RWNPGPVARTTLQSMAAVGEQVMAVGAHTGQVPVGGGAALAEVDDPVVDLQFRRRPTTGPHAGVAVALVDGGAHHLGDVTAVVGDRGDVDAVVGQDLHEGAGQDGPDGLGDRHRPGARRLAHAALAPKPALVDADDDGAVDFCPAAADQVHQGVEAVGGEGLVAALGAGLL